MMAWTDDPISDFNRHDKEQSDRLANLPGCGICSETIQDDHYYLINDEEICPDCLENEFRKEIEDYV